MAINTARANAQRATFAAAKQAQDAGLIDDKNFQRITDGSVSLQDWASALSLRNQNYDSFIDGAIEGRSDTAGQLGHQLFLAINNEREAQGIARTLLETVKDLGAGVPKF